MIFIICLNILSALYTYSVYYICIYMDVIFKNMRTMEPRLYVTCTDKVPY
jgi:hypothetical protein